LPSDSIAGIAQSPAHAFLQGLLLAGVAGSADGRITVVLPACN